MEIIISIIAIVISVISAFYSYKSSRPQVFGRPYIQAVSVVERAGFMCITITVQPGDYSVRLRSLSIPGHRVTRPIPSCRALMSGNESSWELPSTEELFDEARFDFRLDAGSSVERFFAIAAPVSKEFDVRLRFESSWRRLNFHACREK